nr:MAG TPA: hypothetical protein [Crassvirales sp.]
MEEYEVDYPLFTFLFLSQFSLLLLQSKFYCLLFTSLISFIIS